MSSNISASGISRRFRDAGSDLQPEVDDTGFIIPSLHSFTIHQVLEQTAVLVCSQPWIGKTHIARQIDSQRELLDLGDYVWFEPLDEYTPGQTLKPEHWDEWLVSDKKRACWIIDSIDEGEIIQPNLYTTIKRLVESAGDHALNRLKLIVFARGTEVPQGLERFLQEFFVESYSSVELLPLDRDNARRIVGLECFDATVEVIERFALQCVAHYPAALRYISQNLSDPSLTEVKVWRGVLEELLRERGSGIARRKSEPMEVEHLFRAAAHLAVVMSFSDVTQISIAACGSGSVDVADLISADPGPKCPTREAARNAVKTAMFRNGRFSQKNIREWMCAFGLSDIGLSRLKPLITEPSGELNRRHFGMLGLLHKTTAFRREVGDWLIEKNGGVPPQSDVALSLSEAISIVDRLEDIADTTQWNINIWGEKGFDQLAVPGIGHEIAMRIEDLSRSSNRRELLLQIAIETKSPEVVPAAVELIKNPSEDEELRRTALGSVLRLGSEAHLLDLESFVRSSQPRTRVEKAIVSKIIYEYFELSAWPLQECSRYAPEPDSDVVDATYMLDSKLRESMTVESARAIVFEQLPSMLGKKPSLKGKRAIGRRRRKTTFRCALEKILSQDPPDEDDLERIMPLALRVDIDSFESTRGVFFHAPYARSTRARRKLFEGEIRRNARRKLENRTRNYRWILCPEDTEWLMEHAVAIGAKDEFVWEILLSIASQAPQRAKRRAREMVRQHRPAILDAFDRGSKSHKQRERRRKERLNEEGGEQRETLIGIDDAVKEVLASKKWSVQEKMWQLSWICFSGDQERPQNLTGNWDDLTEALRNEVLKTCQGALKTCEPTKIPDSSTFPVRILYEAWCFRDVLRKRADTFGLTASLVRKWLPSMFIVHVEGKEEVISACHRAHREVTEDVFIDAFKRDLRNASEHMFNAANLERGYWSPRIAAEVEGLIDQPQLAERSRAELMRILAERVPEAAGDKLRETLTMSSSAAMRTAALDSLLRVDVGSAWPYVKVAYKQRGKEALLELRSLYHDRRSRISIESHYWTSDILLELARMLHDSFPPADDPERDGWVTPEHEFRDLRNSIPQILFRRNASGDREALKTLVREQPGLANWYNRAIAQEEAIGELARVTLTAPGDDGDIGAPPYQKVIKLLENAAYRLIRNDDDLLDVLEEELRSIGLEAGRHIEMLYLPEEIGKAAQRRHESALQSYFECRLSDRLPNRILDADTSVTFHRERQIQFRERTDIEVNAPLLHSGIGRVVIEVKWSDNNDNRRNVSTALKEQLGDRYLIPDGKTHGIYLVGWNGHLATWRTRAGRRPRNPESSQSLQTELERQSEEYMCDNDGVKIKPVVIDLVWPKCR